MKPTRLAPQQLARAFDQNVATVDARLEEFLKSGDPTTTSEVRKAARRLGTTNSVLPKKARKEAAVRRYVSASRKLARAAGKLRDLDTIAAWARQVPGGKDQKSFASDLDRLRASGLRTALAEAKGLKKTKPPSVDPEDLVRSKVEKRVEKVEKGLSRKVDKEFEEFLSTQEVEVMHALRKDSKRLRHLMELTKDGEAPPLLGRLRSIQDDLGAIRDHDLVIDYLRSRVRLTSTRSLIREEIAKRHARLEEFVTKNRGQGHLVPQAASKKG